MASLSPRPKVAIIIPTADASRDMPRRAIERARSTTAHLDASIHVIESSGPDFRFSRSVNRGIAQAPDADAWVLLNDDCLMDEGWLDAMLDTARSHPDAGIVGALLRYPSGRLQHAGGFMLEPWPYFLHYAFRLLAPFHALRVMRWSRTRAEPYFGHYHHALRWHRLDFVTGACMLITRECRKRIGTYDEDYEFTCEDLDYALRCVESGQEVALAIDAKGVHLSRATGGGLRPQIQRSITLFFQRWPSARVRAATRRGGRTGYHHGGPGSPTCGCAPGA